MRWILAFSMGMAVMAAVAQNQPSKFEVASIKPHFFGGGGPTRIGVSVSGSLVTISTVTLKRLIQQAYDVRDYQIEGGPDWSGGTPGIVFDISARAPGDGQPGQSDIREMLRALLEERFKLAFHREMKEIAAYNLVIGKNGAKLKPSGEGPGAAQLSMGGPTRRIKSVHTNIGGFLGGLTTQLDRPAFDKTGLTGFYDIELEWAANALQPAATDGNGAATPAADIFTAIQEQLGLKLQPAKVTASVLVIDYAEKPSEN